MATITFLASSASNLSDDIVSADEQSTGNGTNYVIDLTAGATIDESPAPEAINMLAGDTLTINGQGATLNGAGYRGLFVYAGVVTIENLTIANAAAIGGAGGHGSFGGGGGAGLGGGLFVAARGVVTLDSVSFQADRATGGAGGSGIAGSTGSGIAAGGGGGMGGAGGAGANGYGGGGGGIGDGGNQSANGGEGGSFPSGNGAGAGTAGMIPGAAGGASNGPINSGGPSGGGGGGGGGDTFGGGGGIRNPFKVQGLFWLGGFGGGGAGRGINNNFAAAGDGGFGGGGGGGILAGDGGFGGGGGGGSGNHKSDGAGGFGGGAGGGAGRNTNGGGSVAFAGGGGGLGAGGDIFVQQGGSLSIAGGLLQGGSVKPGVSSDGAASGGGQGFGSGIFLQGDQSITFAPVAGQTETVDDVIADQDGSYLALGQNIPLGNSADGDPYAGVGSVIIAGAGVVAFAAANTFTGGVTIDSGTLSLGNFAAAGSGAIRFAPGSNATLRLAPGVDPVNAIAGFAAGDAIDLTGVTYKSTYEAVWTPAKGALTIRDTAKANATVAILDFSGTLSGGLVALSKDSGSGMDVGFAPYAFVNVAAGDIVVSNIPGQPYSAYEQIFASGLYAEIDEYFTGASGAAYSAYAYDFSPSGAFIGSSFLYPAQGGATYASEEVDYNGAGQAIRVAYAGAMGQAYSAYEYDYVGGIFSGSRFTFTTVPAGASYSSYEVNYTKANAFAGETFFFANVAGQSYTGEEEDFDAQSKLSRVLLTGVTGQAYSSLEEDYSAGAYTGYKAYYTGITGKSYANEEVDVSSANDVEKVVYSGMTSTPYSSVEQDYINGSPSTTIYGFTDVAGQIYNSYQVEETAGGTPLQETFDLNSGGHSLIALTAGQTLTSLGDDKMSGSSTGSTSFVFDAIYGADTITNLTSVDEVSLPTSEFASFNAMTSHAANASGGVVIGASDGDTLTLKGLTLTTLSGMSADFSFHA